jgi:hypothetical protein
VIAGNRDLVSRALLGERALWLIGGRTVLVEHVPPLQRPQRQGGQAEDIGEICGTPSSRIVRRRAIVVVIVLLLGERHTQDADVAVDDLETDGLEAPCSGSSAPSALLMQERPSPRIPACQVYR